MKKRKPYKKKYLICDTYKILQCFKTTNDNSDFAISQKLGVSKCQVAKVIKRYLEAKIKRINEKARV
jgi:hypothetical protein